MSQARRSARTPAKATTRTRKADSGKVVVAACAAPGDPELPVEAEPPSVALLEPAKSPEAAAPPSRAGLRLEASCTLRDSIDMQFQLLAVDFGDADIVVDGSAVERIDTAGLQMLLSFARHHQGRGKTLRWLAVSPELIRGSQLLGIAGELGIPETNCGSDPRGN